MIHDLLVTDGCVAVAVVLCEGVLWLDEEDGPEAGVADPDEVVVDNVEAGVSQAAFASSSSGL